MKLYRPELHRRNEIRESAEKISGKNTIPREGKKEGGGERGQVGKRGQFHPSTLIYVRRKGSGNVAYLRQCREKDTFQGEGK